MGDEDKTLEEVVQEPAGDGKKKFERKTLSAVDINALKKIGKWEE